MDEFPSERSQHSTETSQLLAVSNNKGKEEENGEEDKFVSKDVDDFDFLSSDYRFKSIYGWISNHRGSIVGGKNSDRELKQERIYLAGCLIRDAVIDGSGGGGIDDNPTQGVYLFPLHNDSPFHTAMCRICRRICSNYTFLRLLRCTIWILALLTFVEPPYWCHESCATVLDQRGAPITAAAAAAAATAAATATATAAAEAAASSSSSSSTLSSSIMNNGTTAVISSTTTVLVEPQQDEEAMTFVDYYPNAHANLITVEQSMIIECICIGIIAIVILIRIGRDGCSLKRYLRQSGAFVPRVVQLLCIVFIVVGLCLEQTRRFNPFLRLILLTSFLKNVQQELTAMVIMFPEVMSIGSLYFLVVLLYACFGTVAFYDTEQGAAGFENVFEATWTLWICITTANYPDVMMPSYNSNRISGLYFVSFMIVSFFFFMNIITSSIYDCYSSLIDDRHDQKKIDAARNLQEAFDLMDFHKEGKIHKDVVIQLFTVLNEEFPSVKKLSHLDLTFHKLDVDQSCYIDKEEFMNIGDVLLYEFVEKSKYLSFVQTHFPTIADSPFFQNLCTVVTSKMFDYVVDIILVLNGVVVFIQTYPILSGNISDYHVKPEYNDGQLDTVWELMEAIFTAIYVVEVLLKVLVLGWTNYIGNQRNVFDFVVTILAVVASAYVYYPNAYSNSTIIRYIIAIRMFRLIRVLTSRSQFQRLGKIVTKLLPELYRFMTLLFVVMYFFSVLGVLLYGGMITRDPQNRLSYLLLTATDFTDNEYWANNFNDVISGMNVLFNLLVINNWTECEIGFEAVTEAKWVRMFFFSFHVIGVVFVSNVITSAFIDNVVTEQQQQQKIDSSILSGGTGGGGGRAAATATGADDVISANSLLEQKQKGLFDSTTEFIEVNTMTERGIHNTTEGYYVKMRPTVNQPRLSRLNS